MKESPNQPRVALVTGGSRGIGRAVAASLLEDGWTVFSSSRSPESVAAASEDLGRRFHGRYHAKAADIRKESEVEALVRWVVDEAGRLDCLINNAGVGIFRPVHELSGDEWRQVIDTNLTGAFYAIRAAAPALRESGNGWIVNIASIAAKNPFATGAAYNASKFGMLGLSEAAMLDLRHLGVRVTTIMPGSVYTEFGSGPAGEEWKLAPEDVARTVRDVLAYPDRALPSRIELRPTRPPR